jgi:hypothetical protein
MNGTLIQRENIRARHVYSDTDPDLVLAPSDFWKVNFQARLESLLKDEDKFLGDSYMCEETIVEISIERSRQCGLTKRCRKLEIELASGLLIAESDRSIFPISFYETYDRGSLPSRIDTGKAVRLVYHRGLFV